MLAKLQEERLRLYCFRNRTDQDYFPKNNPGYQGCEEIGCSGHHHWSLHWQVAVCRLFEVDVWPESYELGSRIFTLRQNLKGERVRCNLAFNGSSDRTLVTERFTELMGFRKLDGTLAVVGFAETTPAFGDVYTVSVKDRCTRGGVDTIF
jgi:hypothetical protein